MKRVTLFCGHYGSGKTNLAVNYAFKLKNEGFAVAIADMDIVNPYFRTRDSEAELRAAGIEVMGLPYARSNVDLPALPSELYGLFQRRDIHAICDLGGDDRGALALGRFRKLIEEENDYELIFVVNFYRPLTPDPAGALEAMAEISRAAGLPFTGIINNSNLGQQTAPEDVLRTVPLAEEFSERSGVPLIGTSAMERICSEPGCEGFIPLTLQNNLY